MDKTTLEHFQQVPIAELTAPKSGIFHVRVNEFWAVTDDNCLLFYTGRGKKRRHYTSPQCNSNEDIARKVSESYDFPVTVKQLAIVYVPVNLSDY